MKEKLANLVLFDKVTYEKMLNDVPKLKLITPSIISEKLKVNGSLARKAVKELLAKSLIRALTASCTALQAPHELFAPICASTACRPSDQCSSQCPSGICATDWDTHSISPSCPHLTCLFAAGPILQHKQQNVFTRATNQ